MTVVTVMTVEMTTSLMATINKGAEHQDWTDSIHFGDF